MRCPWPFTKTVWPPSTSHRSTQCCCRLDSRRHNADRFDLVGRELEAIGSVQGSYPTAYTAKNRKVALSLGPWPCCHQVSARGDATAAECKHYNFVRNASESFRTASRGRRRVFGGIRLHDPSEFVRKTCHITWSIVGESLSANRYRYQIRGSD